MVSRLHTKSKIIIPDPFVIRVDHDFSAGDFSAFRHFPKLARQRAFSTWGYSQPINETVRLKKQEPILNNAQLLASIFDNDVAVIVRSYWFFEDKMDATSYRLSIGEKAQHVHMWPETLLFTIFEHSDES
jgi:hypothetical protein